MPLSDACKKFQCPYLSFHLDYPDEEATYVCKVNYRDHSIYYSKMPNQIKVGKLDSIDKLPEKCPYKLEHILIADSKGKQV